MLGPCGPLVCWGYPCRGVLHTPHRAPPSVANVPPRYVHRYVRRVRAFGYPAKFAGVRRRPGFRRPGFRPGLWSTGPTARPGTGERPVGAPNHSQGRNPWAAKPWVGRVPDAVEYGRGGTSIRAHGPVWGAYAIRPYRGTCIRVPSGTRPNSPASADARPYRGTCIRVPSGTRPASPASVDAPRRRKP